MLRPSPAAAAMAMVMAMAVTSPAFADDGLAGLECRDGEASAGCPLPEPLEAGMARVEWAMPQAECEFDGAVVPCERDGNWLGGDGCYYAPFDGTEKVRSVETEDGSSLYTRVCYLDGEATRWDSVWLARSPITVPPQVLAQKAVAKLRLPAPKVHIAPWGAQRAGQPTWLWLDTDSWRPQSQTAAMPGMTVTATATPVGTSWELGDGSTVECDGPGTPWTGSFGPKSASPDCGHTYETTSEGEPDGQYAVTVTLTWSVSWIGGNGYGTVPEAQTVRQASWPVERLPPIVPR